MARYPGAHKAPTIGPAQKEKLKNTLAMARKIQQSRISLDDFDEHFAFALSLRDLIVPLKRLACPILPEAAASRLNSLDVEVNDLSSACEARAELDALVPVIEDALGSTDNPTNALFSESLKLLLRGRRLDTVSEEIERSLANVEPDPPVAITAACSALEALLKVYAEDKSLEVPTKKSLKRRWTVASKHLALDPAQERDDHANQVLSGLCSVVEGIGCLTTRTGSAYGRGRSPYRPKLRHVRLAVQASLTLVEFFVETWNEREQGSVSV